MPSHLHSHEENEYRHKKNSHGYLEDPVLLLGLQIPDVDGAIQASTHKKLGGGVETDTSLFFLGMQTSASTGSDTADK